MVPVPPGTIGIGLGGGGGLGFGCDGRGFGLLFPISTLLSKQYHKKIKNYP